DYASREAQNYRLAQGEWEDVIALAIERDNLAILNRAFIEFEEAEAEVQNITYRELLEANYMTYERIFLKELKAIRDANAELNFQEIFSQSRRLKLLDID
ncbi:MAG: hypothetical protein Q4G11_07135, partial [Gallicola sp.]|nr:hypothetical protein [Gallicola sp.]